MEAAFIKKRLEEDREFQAAVKVKAGKAARGRGRWKTKAPLAAEAKREPQKRLPGMSLPRMSLAGLRLLLPRQQWSKRKRG